MRCCSGTAVKSCQNNFQRTKRFFRKIPPLVLFLKWKISDSSSSVNRCLLEKLVWISNSAKYSYFLFKNTRNLMVVTRGTVIQGWSYQISVLIISSRYTRWERISCPCLTIDWSLDPNSFCIRTSDCRGRSINGVQKSKKPKSCENLENVSVHAIKLGWFSMFRWL